MFIDGSGKSHKAAVTWYDGVEWKDHVVTQIGSAQVVELRAAVEAFHLLPNSSFNLIADSAYVTGILLQMPDVSLHFANTADITLLLVDLIPLIHSHHTDFFVIRIRSHSN